MTTRKPEISVICANYNHAQYMEFAINSISHQTFADFEIIIVDDGSTDNSREVIEKIVKTDDRIQKPIYLGDRSTRPAGKWYALNKAIETAKGKLVTIQDMDDASCPQRLKRQLQVLRDTNAFHVPCGFTHCYSQDDMEEAILWKADSLGYDIIYPPEVTKLVLQGLKTPGINHYFMGFDYEVHGASPLYYKQLHTFGMKYLPGDLGLRCQLAEDGDFNTKVTLLLQKTSVLKEPLYVYRRNSATNDAFKQSL